MPSFLNVIDTGTVTMLSGCRSMLKKFVEKREITDYSGEEQCIKYPKDNTYWSSKLRFVPFDETFTFLPNDASKRMCLL